MAKFLVMPVAGVPVVKEIETLEQLQAEVGGYIELIGGDGWSAYLNEEGKIHGLPPNQPADALARTLGFEFLPGDALVGTVLFCGPPDSDGHDTDVPDSVREKIIP
jgi:hypothetical protein